MKQKARSFPFTAMAPLSIATETNLSLTGEAELVSSPALAPIVSLRTGRAWAVESEPRSARDVLTVAEAWPGKDASGLALRLTEGPLPELLAALEALGALLDARALPRGRISIEATSGPTSFACTLAEASRDQGFLVVSTEVGVGHPYIDRIELLAPDVLKIDARLTAGVASARGRLEACRAVVELARSIGALIVADEVVAVADVVELALLGIDLFEGPLIEAPETSTELLRARLRRRAEEEVVRRRGERAVHDRVFVAVMSRIAQARANELDIVAEQIVRDVPGLEALYVLDQRGVQLTRTWFNPAMVARGGFQPAERGADLGLKEYFLEVGHGSGYVSRPYVSMASGRISVTHSRRLRLCDSTNVVVCCDVPSASL